MTDLSTYFTNNVSPIEASVFNTWGAEIEGVRDEAVTARDDAIAAAEAAAAPADDQIGALLGTPGTVTRAVADSLYAPVSLSGMYAARPAATAVPARTIYYATDVPEQYRSNGTVWSVVGSGGSELGYTQITSTGVAQGPTAAAVPALSVTFVAGERPAVAEFASLFQVASTGVYVIATIKLGTDSVGSSRLSTTVASQYVSLARAARLTGLTPGASYTVTVQVSTDSGTVTPFASATNPIWLQVRTL